VPDIVEQDGQVGPLGFIIGDINAFGAQNNYSLPHQVHGAQGVLKTCMLRRRISVIGKPELLDPPQPLEPWMFDHIKNEGVGNGDESVYRIIDDLLFIGCRQNRVNLLKKYKTGSTAQ